jgi:hypothetical protein
MKVSEGRAHEDLKAILQSLGLVLIIVGVLSVLPLLVAAFYNEDLLPFYLFYPLLEA